MPKGSPLFFYLQSLESYGPIHVRGLAQWCQIFNQVMNILTHDFGDQSWDDIVSRQKVSFFLGFSNFQKIFSVNVLKVSLA